MSTFNPLTFALEGWFDTKLCDMPEALRQRVEREFFDMPWDNLADSQRRSLALQLDYQHDPATQQDQQFWFDFFVQVESLEKQIARWEVVATPTAAEMALQETRLSELRRELARMKAQQRNARGDYYPKNASPDRQSDASSPSGHGVGYIAFPKAMDQLAERLGAIPEELAAWVFFGPDTGGVAAYLNANELDPPPRFDFQHLLGTTSQDYVGPLMACWFKESDIATFEPSERYMTGLALVERWLPKLGYHPAPYIRAKVVESRLEDFHPTHGGTQAGDQSDPDLPPLESALFKRAEVEQIEAVDFVTAVKPDTAIAQGNPATTDAFNAPELGSSEWRRQNARDAANALHDKPGGSRDKQRRIREIWNSGKYTSRDICAEQECAALDMSFSVARKALKNYP